MEELKTIKMRYLIFSIILLKSFFISAQDSVTYTLKQCIDVALANNLNLKISELQMESNDVRLQQARAANLPYLSAYASQGINSGKSINPYTNTFINQQIVTGQYGINAGWVVWNGLSSLNSMRQSAFAYKAGKSDWEQAKIDLTINVILSYLNVLSYTEQLKQARSQVEVTKEQIVRLDVLEKNNAVSPSVLYDTKGQLANDKLAFVNAKSGLNSAITSLAQLLNISFPSNVKFEKLGDEAAIPSAENSEAVFSEAEKNYPAFKSTEFKRMSAVKGLHASRGQLFPTLTINGNIGTNYSDAATLQKISPSAAIATDQYVVVNNNSVPVYAPTYNVTNEKISFNSQFKNNLNSYVGISLQFNLFNSFRTKTQMNLSKINKEQAEYQQKSTYNNLKSVINQAHSDMLLSYEKLEIIKEQVKDYNASYKVAVAKFEKGAISTLEYITAKSNLDKSSMALIAARYDYVLKQKVLDYYKGKF